MEMAHQCSGYKSQRQMGLSLEILPKETFHWDMLRNMLTWFTVSCQSCPHSLLRIFIAFEVSISFGDFAAPKMPRKEGSSVFCGFHIPKSPIRGVLPYITGWTHPSSYPQKTDDPPSNLVRWHESLTSLNCWGGGYLPKLPWLSTKLR